MGFYSICGRSCIVGLSCRPLESCATYQWSGSSVFTFQTDSCAILLVLENTRLPPVSFIFGCRPGHFLYRHSFQAATAAVAVNIFCIIPFEILNGRLRQRTLALGVRVVAMVRSGIRASCRPYNQVQSTPQITIGCRFKWIRKLRKGATTAWATKGLEQVHAGKAVSAVCADHMGSGSSVPCHTHSEFDS